MSKIKLLLIPLIFAGSLGVASAMYQDASHFQKYALLKQPQRTMVTCPLGYYYNTTLGKCIKS